MKMLTYLVKALVKPQGVESMLCRVCLLPNENLRPLDLRLGFDFDVPGSEKTCEEYTLRQLLEEVTGSKDISCQLFGGLCEDCFEAVGSSFLFRRKCLRSNDTLKRTLDILEHIVQEAQIAAPTSTILAQVSLLALTDLSSLIIKNYQSHENNLSELTFMNEIIRVETNPACEMHCGSPSLKSDFEDTAEKDRLRGDLSSRQCPHCGKVFQYPSYLKNHLNYHGERVHSCKKCTKSFKTKADLKRHFNSHKSKDSTISWLGCPYCDKTFTTRPGLKSHLVYHESGKYTCTICRKSFDTTYRLNHHRKITHEKERASYICDHCGRTLASRYSFKMHLKSHNRYTDDAQPLPCPQCGKIFKKLSVLNIHLKHHGDRNLSCAACNKLFFTKGEYCRHYRTVHLKDRLNLSFKCDHCGSALSSRSSLIAHLKTHEPRTSKLSSVKQLCPICGKFVICQGLAALKIHMESHGVATYSCSVCNKWFKTRTSLNIHYKYLHTPIDQKESYICDHCGVARSRKCSIAVHLRTHEPKAAYQCKACSKIFERDIYLRKHMRTHQNIRPEQCAICKNRFVNKKALLYHSRLHTGEKPYECEVCGQRFVSENRKKMHYKGTHTDKTIPCTFCGSLFHTKSHMNRHVKKVHLKDRRSRNVSLTSEPLDVRKHILDIY